MALGVDISNLKLQKLVVLAESLSEYALGRRAFEEPVQAWKNGPAVKPLYGRYKVFGSDPITAVDRVDTFPLDEPLNSVVDEVWSVAGHLPAGGLYKLTHEVGPWVAHFKPGVDNIVLPGAELGRAWPDYVACASRLTAYRQPVRTPILGVGQSGFASEQQYQEAAQRFHPSRSRAGD